MIGQLILKEIKLKILDLRFIISTLIVLLLVIFSVIVLSEKYQKEIDDYQIALQNDEKELGEVQVYSFLEPKLHYPPNPLSIFNKGISEKINRTVVADYITVPRQDSEIISENPLLNIYRQFDLTTVFRLVLSLLAVILVYDSFSGEKEAGTLKLMLSNGIKRSHILAGKLVSNILIMSVPVILSFLFSLLIITFFYGIEFTGVQWIRIGMIILSTLVFLSFFIALGLLISSATHKTPVSLILLTSLWVILCVLQPNLGPYIASSVIKIPSNETLEQAYAETWNEFSLKQDRILEQIMKKIPPGRQNGNVMGFGDNDHRFAVMDGTTPMLMTFLYRTMEIEPLRHEYAEREWAIYQSLYLPPLEKQQRWQKYINYLSPAALFESAASTLSQTDVSNYDHFLETGRMYRSTLMAYLKNDRKIFSDNANEYFTRLDKEEMGNSQFERRLETGTDYRWSNTPPLDLSGMPRFFFQPASIAMTLNQILFQFLLLIAYTATLILAAAGMFRKYDPR